MNNPLDNKKSKVAEREEEVLKYWRDRKIFEKTLNQTKKGKPFVFYDGPPFATGLPHYGHILTGTIKDVIPRYQTMRGRYVRREWGWDCHGLPLENIIEQELDLKHKKTLKSSALENLILPRQKQFCATKPTGKKQFPKLGVLWIWTILTRLWIPNIPNRSGGLSKHSTTKTYLRGLQDNVDLPAL